MSPISSLGQIANCFGLDCIMFDWLCARVAYKVHVRATPKVGRETSITRHQSRNNQRTSVMCLRAKEQAERYRSALSASSVRG